MFSKECKQIEKEKKIRYVTDDLEISNSDSEEEQIKAKYHGNVFF